MKLLPKYKEKGFAKMGLFVFFNEPPIPFNIEISIKRFAEIQKESDEQYDFLFFGYRNGVIGYDFHSMSYESYVIDQDKFDDMSMHVRRFIEK